MYNENLVKITEQNGKVLIKSPFNAQFVKELTLMVPSARWTGSVWRINASGREQAEELLAKYYPPNEELQKVRITWNDLQRETPQIDGINLASVNRDWWNWRKDCPVDFKVISQSLESGGSRKSPGLFGELSIEVSIRPGANISPKPDTLEVVEDGKVPNPLADFSTEDLIAELRRRGETI